MLKKSKSPKEISKFATKKELEAHKKEVKKMINETTKAIKKWDVKQDSQFAKKKSKKSKL